MQHIRQYLLETKHKRRKAVYEYLQRTYGVHVCDKRISVSGGVGSVQWLPRFGCYRIQVGANHITTKKPCFNYAPCIELYDI